VSSGAGAGYRNLRRACAIAIGMYSFVPNAAHAYCRTTTSPVPLGYDPTTDGCWKQGVPLKWPGARVPYGVGAAASKQVSLADATRIADLAFDAWNQVQCGGNAVGVQAYDDGPITMVPDAGYLVPAGSDASILAGWASCAESNACDATAHDVIVFDDDAWPHDDSANTLALTTVTFGAVDGRIFEAYTEVNSAETVLTTTEPPTAGAYDLQAILTHEAGHFLGLAHSADTSALMYALYQPGAIQLTADDTDAICAVYPANQAGGGCSLAVVGESPSTAWAIEGLSCAALLLLRRRGLPNRPRHRPRKIATAARRRGQRCRS
jgi:Matrixin